MTPFSSLFDFVSLFFEINFLVDVKGSFLVVDQGVVDAVSFAGEEKGGSRVVVDDAVAVGGHRIIDVGYPTGDGSVPCDFGIKHFHFRGLMRTDLMI